MTRSSKDIWYVFIGTLLSLALAFGAFGETLLGKKVLESEDFYLAAAIALKEGRETSSVWGYYYSDIFAAWLSAFERPQDALPILRLLNAIGISMMIASGSMIVGRATNRWLGLVLVPLGTLFLPGMNVAFATGNISGVMFTPMILALITQNHMAKSILLSIACFPKPYGLGVTMTMKWRYWILPLAVAGIAAATSPSMGVSGLEHVREPTNISPAYGLSLLGIPWQVSTVLALVAAALSRGKTWHGVCLGVLALPIVWDHTALVMILPIAIVFENLLQEQAGRLRSLRFLGLLFVVLVYLRSSFFGVEGAPLILQVVAAEIPTIAFLMLMAFLKKCDR